MYIYMNMYIYKYMYIYRYLHVCANAFTYTHVYVCTLLADRFLPCLSVRSKLCIHVHVY